MTFKAQNFAFIRFGLLFLSCVAYGCAISPAPLVEIREAPRPIELMWHLDTTAAVISMAFSFDGKHLVLGMDNGTVMIFELGKSTPERIFDVDHKIVSSVAVSPDGRLVAAVSHDEQPSGTAFHKIPIGVQLYQWQDNKTSRIDAGSGISAQLQFSPDSQWLAISADALTIRNVKTRESVFSFGRDNWGLDPLFFFRGAKGTSLAAVGQVFGIDGSAVVPLGPTLRQPDIVSPEGIAFYGFAPHTLEEPFPIALTKAGILEGPIQGKPSAFLVLKNESGRIFPKPAGFLTSEPAGPGPKLLANVLYSSKLKVIVVDLVAKEYQVLVTKTPSVDDSIPVVAVSPTKRLAAVGVSHGVSVWKIP